MLMQAISETDSGHPRQMDITAPEGPVEVQISANGTVLWINLEGVCVLRVCRCSQITVED